MSVLREYVEKCLELNPLAKYIDNKDLFLTLTIRQAKSKGLENNNLVEFLAPIATYDKDNIVGATIDLLDLSDEELSEVRAIRDKVVSSGYFTPWREQGNNLSLAVREAKKRHITSIYYKLRDKKVKKISETQL